MQTVRSIAEQIVAREGGFVNDPDDPGGATKHGVTIHTMRALGLDLDGDGDVDVNDVRRITPELATDLFLEHYFTRPNIHMLPDPLQASVFDMQVNAGSNAVRILQHLLRDMGLDIAVDGAIGPQTARAAHAAINTAPDHLVDAYGIARRNYYYRLADRRPASRKYARRRDGGKGGWIIRAEEFISPRYHLTAAQHRDRTASWD
ncbi:holin-associated N-acetylmuramidase [Gymnodinialimonas sp. 57CJ19]|uniref:holin-associated N-acetylmuramidase n=1 Tax=Gymnodinialimonas sp. 57CJ19 TaxID=3138498 RepID=UPI0031345A53